MIYFANIEITINSHDDNVTGFNPPGPILLGEKAVITAHGRSKAEALADAQERLSEWISRNTEETRAAARGLGIVRK